MNLRTARQIKLDKNHLSNKNISVKIGTIENRNSPETIYIEISFWIKPSLSTDIDPILLKRKLSKELKDLYKIHLRDLLEENKIFPEYDDNIFITNMPENVNYNNKKNFISLELYLHTLNLNSPNKKYPLIKNENSEIFRECLKVINILSNTDMLNNNKDFEIYLTK